MSIRKISLMLAAVALLACCRPVVAGDDDLAAFGDEPVRSAYRFPSAAELRQARALYQQQNRLARIEANEWAGYDPLRPTMWTSAYTQPYYRVYRPYRIWSVYDYAR